MVAVNEPTSSEAVAAAETEVMSREQKIEKADMLYVAGKKALMKGVFDEATDTLADVLSLRTEVYGAKAEELFDAMMLYGKSLLEMSRVESNVLAGAFEGLEDTPCDDSNVEDNGEEKTEAADKKDDKIDGPEMTEEEREAVADKVEDALAENAEAIDNKQPLPTGDEEKKDVSAEETKEEKADAVEKTDESTDDKTSEEEEKEDGDDETAEDEEEDLDDLPNIQLAIENVEVARMIATEYLADVLDEKKPMWREKLADTLLLLGEIYIEHEQFERALVELQACLDEQKTAFPSWDRRIAETYFQMGRAYTQCKAFDKAAEVYKHALAVITELKNKKSTDAEKEAADDDKKALTDEVERLGKLIEDIESWVKDSVESHASAVEVRAELKADTEKAGETSIASTTDASAPTQDIMVRKRKVDDAPTDAKTSPGKENTAATVDVGAEETQAKKAKVDDVNADAEGNAVE